MKVHPPPKAGSCRSSWLTSYVSNASICTAADRNRKQKVYHADKSGPPVEVGQVASSLLMRRIYLSTSLYCRARRGRPPRSRGGPGDPSRRASSSVEESGHRRRRRPTEAAQGGPEATDSDPLLDPEHCEHGKAARRARFSRPPPQART